MTEFHIVFVDFFYGIMDTLFIIYTLTYCFKSVCLTLKKHYTDLIKFGRLTCYIVNIHQYVIVYNTSHGYICRVPFVEILDCCPLNLTKTFFILNLLCSWTLLNPFKFYWDILVENVKKNWIITEIFIYLNDFRDSKFTLT